MGAEGKQCYYNAFRVIMEIPEYSNAEYVEGMAVDDHGLAFEHGWIEKEGAIVDPTLPAHELIYFPGLQFTGRVGLAKAVKIPKPRHTREDFPIFYRFGWGGIESPEFCAACVRHIATSELKTWRGNTRNAIARSPRPANRCQTGATRANRRTC